VPLKLRTVRVKTAKLTLELESGAGEMYDLLNDPHEMNNLFDEPDYAGLRGELTRLIQERPGEEMDEFDEAVGMA